MTPEIALAANRFLHDASLSLIWGGVGYSLVVDSRVGRLFRDRHSGSISTCVGIAVLTSLLAYPLQSVSITQDWSSAGDTQTLFLMAQTGVGEAIAIQIATALSMLALHLAKSDLGAVLTAGLMLAELATVGHATEGGGEFGLTHELVTAIHVLSGTAWLGALVPFTFVLTISASEELRRPCIAALKKFSILGHIAVFLVLVSGVVNVWLTVGRPPLNLASDYDVKLLIKIAAVAAMTMSAIVNRYSFVPMMRTQCADGRKLLLIGSFVEIALGLVAIGLVASFGLEDPT